MEVLVNEKGYTNDNVKHIVNNNNKRTGELFIIEFV